MPHRVEPESQQAAQYKPAQFKSQSNSPAPSATPLNRSAVSTPPIDQGQRSQERGLPSQQYAYEIPRGYGGYIYAYAPPPPHHDERYDAHQHPHPHTYAHPAGFPIQHPGYAPYPLHPAPPQNNPAPTSVIQVVHTDDAATKLSDRVRRRCFNCCTTDTTTWRRSNLSPGKVLCNKCGLFERTHSRPRPEQFPHKRGPLASSKLGSRSPPRHYAPPPSHYSTPAAPAAHTGTTASRSSCNGNANENGEERRNAPPREQDERKKERTGEDA
ncbi:hypothetical protein FB451DRAFT_1411773 [Mycena latifolia]|nr:hypothetical protein FB451DRAFT_1411773 [Mycena latifolia]